MKFMQNILKYFIKNPKKTAVVIDNITYSYGFLISQAQFLSAFFKRFSYKNRPCIILSERTIYFYISVLACFFSNAIYTPINIFSASERNKKILTSFDDVFFYVGDIDYDVLLPLIKDVFNKDFLVSNKKTYDLLTSTNFDNRFHYLDSNSKMALKKAKPKANTDIAYLLFTSGSTGLPKGVAISYDNLDAYLESIHSIFSIDESDRLIQLADIGFDISIHEMLVCWSSGATLYVYNEAYQSNLAAFIAKNAITHTILIPSMIPLILKQCAYFNLQFDFLKLSLFCGEPFPITYAESWHSIAKESMIVNLYGPTEVTVGCLYHVYSKEHDYGSQLTLPIGLPFPNTHVDLTDYGEMIISGVQVANGYWSSAKHDSKRFYQDVETNLIHYFSGDKARYHAVYGFLFQGRLDDQWKMKGYRIEKSEIENKLRSVIGVNEIYVTPTFFENGLVKSLVAFSNEKIDINLYRKTLSDLLPEPVIPSEFLHLENIPRLSNGKIDYRNVITH